MSMESSRIKGSIVALVTPMDEEGGVNHETLKQLVEWHIEQGTDCIVAVGTTGESPTVTVDEQCAIIKTCVEQAKGRIPIMAGCGANSTQEAITLAKHAKELGADCQLQVVPYYNKPTQEGLYSHFVAIADAIDLPVMLYNVPGRTVADLQHDTVLRLAQHPNILGIKEATGNLERAQGLIREAPKDFSVYSGDDATAVMLMLAGGSGNVSVTANVAPRLMSELCMAAMGKNVERAMSLQYQLLPLHKSLFCEANPIPVKWAVSRIGKCKNTLRLPMTPLSAANCKVVEESLVKVGLID